MFLFIFQSIGTQELILIGIFALIFLGPRKLPEYARKIGKMMAEFRGTAEEFKTTWEREIDFEEETKALSLNSLESEDLGTNEPVSREKFSKDETVSIIEPPTIRPIDDERLKDLQVEATACSEDNQDTTADEAIDKQNWL